MVSAWGVVLSYPASMVAVIKGELHWVVLVEGGLRGCMHHAIAVLLCGPLNLCVSLSSRNLAIHKHGGDRAMAWGRMFSIFKAYEVSSLGSATPVLGLSRSQANMPIKSPKLSSMG
jgi:hypothetical protein